MLTHEIPAPQKARLLRAMLPALVTGQAWQVAWEAHLVAYEWDRENARLADLALHLRFLAVTGLWHRLLRLLERHLGLIRQARDAWDLLLGLRNIVAALDSLDLNGMGGKQLKISVARISRFHDIPDLIRPTVREARDVLGRALFELVQRFGERNGNNQILESLEILDYSPLPSGITLQGDSSDSRFLARLLRVRALLECDQGFDALLVLGGLEQTNFPSRHRLNAEIQMLTSLARMQISHDSANRAQLGEQADS